MASSVIKRFGKAILDIAIEKKNTDVWIGNFIDSKEIIGSNDKPHPFITTTHQLISSRF